MAAVWRTDIGLVRAQNEDALWADEARGIFAVADGMGGHLAGEVASGMAIDAVQTMAEHFHRAGVTGLLWAMRRANETILERARLNPECSGMGTTLSLLWRGEEMVYAAHVGDSRIYRLHGGALEQVTRDHSLVEELVTSGLITKEEARVHPRRNIITRALGTEGDNEPDLLTLPNEPGDTWLVCSDGLSSMVEDEAIRTAIEGRTLEAAADELVRLALDAGGRDNISLILYREEDAPWNRG